jgi:hypothetical protein
MGATVKIHIKQARNLPIMDRASNLADAYVQLKFGPNFDERTPVAKKTLNPIFNQTFRIEVDDVTYIQDNVIEFVLWDSDLVSDDVIGTVLIDVNLLTGPDLHQMSGWFPIFDSFRGICGELYVSIKVDCLLNLKETIFGVKFFSNCDQSLITNHANASFSNATPNSALLQTPKSSTSSSNPTGTDNNNNNYYEMSKISMIEELLIDDDPEHDYWKDMMRSSRTSNLERQLLLFQLSGKVRRLMAKKVLEAGCNTIAGYYEHFDLESENIIVRGMGTQCRLDKVHQVSTQYLDGSSPHSIFDLAVSSPSRKNSTLSGSPSALLASSATSFSFMNIAKSPQIPSSLENVNTVLKLTTVEDVALCTMKSFEQSELKHMAQVVQARAVKLLSDMKIDQLGKQRDKWWNEMRQEIRENTRMLGCTHIIGYREQVHIHPKGNVCILSAEGTAAILSDNMYADLHQQSTHCPYSVFHIAQSPEQSPFQPKRQLHCRHCKTGLIPEVVFSTCEIPQDIPYVNQHFLEARILRMKHKKIGERNAKSVSSMLPFLEYDLHKQMLHKMRIYHVNAVFNVTYNIAVEDQYIIATVTGTGVYLECVPDLPSMRFTFNRMTQKMALAQTQLQKLSSMYKQTALHQISEVFPNYLEDEDDIELDIDSIENNVTAKNVPIEDVKPGYIIEIDDETDEDKMMALVDPILPGGITFSNMRTTTSLSDPSTMTVLQNIFIQKRYNLSKLTGLQFQEQQHIAAIYNDVYSTVAFKLRLFVDGSDNVYSVHVAGMSTDLQFTSENELMITFEATAILNTKLSSSTSPSYHVPPSDRLPELLPKQVFMPLPQHQSIKVQQHHQHQMDDHHMMFTMEDHNYSHVGDHHHFDEDSEWLSNVYITMTPLSYVPGTRIQKVLGKVAQHLIRESETVTDFGLFQQELVMEANAIIRAHTKALGMNCLLNYSIKFHVVLDNSTTSKRQGYAVITVCGDAAYIVRNESRKVHGLRAIVSLSS